MARRNRDELIAAASEALEAGVDESGTVDLLFERGSIIVAAETDEFKSAFKRIKKVAGYRWVLMNEEDLFAANTLSLGSKAGLITAEGKVLKNADVPRKKV
jgi:hypothetical protein